MHVMCETPHFIQLLHTNKIFKNRYQDKKTESERSSPPEDCAHYCAKNTKEMFLKSKLFFGRFLNVISHGLLCDFQEFH
jgi:hypothetical protein